MLFSIVGLYGHTDQHAATSRPPATITVSKNMNNIKETSGNSPYVPTGNAPYDETNPSGRAPVNPFAALVKMFYEPTRTFEALEPKKQAWLPIILVIATMTAVTLWYFSVVDAAWFIEQMFSTMKEKEREAAAQMLNANTMKISMIGGQLIGTPIVLCITGLYFLIAGKIAKRPVSFGTGFSLAAWSMVPTLLLLPLAAIQILMSTSPQFEYSALNMLSVNQLVFQYPMSNPMAAVFDSISIVSIWNAVLLIIGFQVWAKAQLATAVKVVLIPYAVVYGIWIAFALNKVPA